MNVSAGGKDDACVEQSLHGVVCGKVVKSEKEAVLLDIWVEGGAYGGF